MKIISCYSYKGGTGRSTSTANLAAAIAKRGKNVLVMDLDIEAPGLSVIFGVQGKENVAIQDYLNKPSEFDHEDMIIDIVDLFNKEEEGNCWPENAGKCFFIPARIGVEPSTIVNYEEDRIHQRLKDLLKNIAADKKLAIDYVIIDAASGYGDMSAVSMALSDLLLVFFRWSRQHLYGTVKIAQFFKFLVEEKKVPLDYQFVANAVPTTEEGSKHAILKENIKAYLEESVGQKLFMGLPENSDMKWNERLIVFNENAENRELVEAFVELADKSIEILKKG